MKFVKINKFKIMECGTTVNGLEITSSMIENALINETFTGKPILYNENQNFKDYRDEDTVNDFQNKKCIGFITDEVWQGGLDKNVYAIVYLKEEFSNREDFDNWQINYDKELKKFEYCACELFKA